MKNISLKHRLVIPIALLGMVALLSNILSIVNIQNVNASASNIADNYMDGSNRLAEICELSMNIHQMAGWRICNRLEYCQILCWAIWIHSNHKNCVVHFR